MTYKPKKKSASKEFDYVAREFQEQYGNSYEIEEPADNFYHKPFHSAPSHTITHTDKNKEENRHEHYPVSHDVDIPPDNLSHKPIYFTPLHDIEGSHSDAKFLSFGLAQFDRNILSVKIFRHSGKRWSRQSEEIPLKRFVKMSVFAVKIIMEAMQANKKNSTLSNFITVDNDHFVIKKMNHSEATETNFKEKFDMKLTEELLKDLKTLKTQLDEMSTMGLLNAQHDERKPGMFKGSLDPTFFDSLPDKELQGWEAS